MWSIPIQGSSLPIGSAEGRNISDIIEGYIRYVVLTERKETLWEALCHRA